MFFYYFEACSPFLHHYYHACKILAAVNDRGNNTGLTWNNATPKRYATRCKPAMTFAELEARRSGLQSYLSALSVLKESWNLDTVTDVLCCSENGVPATGFPSIEASDFFMVALYRRLIGILQTVCCRATNGMCRGSRFSVRSARKDQHNYLRK